MIRLLAVINAAVLVVAVVMAVAGPVGPGAVSTVASIDVSGAAEISGGGDSRRVDPGEYELRTGDTVEILTGEGVVSLPGGGSLELRSGDGATEASQVRLDEVPTLVAGDALLIAGDEERVVEAGGARLSLVDGAARLSRSTGAIFAVYQGAATLSSGGRRLEGGLPPLRQVVVADAGLLPLRPSPLSFGAAPDPWDRRFLGDAIDLGDTLARRSTGFTTLLPDDLVPNVFFFQAVLPGLLQEPAFDQALLDGQQRPVGETLVGAAIALVGDVGTFESRWHEVFRLREAGASWGVVALDQGADRAPLLDVLDDAAERSPLLFGAPSSQPVFSPAPSPSDRPAPVVAPPSTPSRPPASGPSAPLPPPPSSPPPPVLVPAPPREPEGVLEPVVDPLVNLLDGVLDGLGGLL